MFRTSLCWAVTFYCNYIYIYIYIPKKILAKKFYHIQVLNEWHCRICSELLCVGLLHFTVISVRDFKMLDEFADIYSTVDSSS